MRVCLSVLLLLPGLAHAYVTTDGDRTRWRQAPQPGIDRLSGDLPAAPCRLALQAAFTSWAEEGLLLLPPPIEGPADITVGFVADRPDLVGVVGITLTTTRGAGVDASIVRAEVLLNDDFVWSIDGPRGTFRVQATATHEIGHALGLGHSADRAAAMYWHYDPQGAALAGDDRRGLRFLYGDAMGLGRSCDQCEVAADCAGGICLQRFNEGDRPFCARACEAGCDADEICVALRNGGDACVPAHGFCGDGGGLARDAACWGPFQCTAPDRCVVHPGDARCSAACQGPADCANDRVCTLDPFDLPRVCLTPGVAELGADCAWATDCASGVCLPSGVCGAWCVDACPAGWRCAAHARWPGAPRVCQPEGPDAGGLDAGGFVDAQVDARPRIGTDAAPGDAAIDARMIDTAIADSLKPTDAQLFKDALPVVEVVPVEVEPVDGGCAQGGGRDSAAWLAVLGIALGCRRRFGWRRAQRAWHIGRHHSPRSFMPRIGPSIIVSRP